MRFADRLHRLLAANSIERQLFPAPVIPFSFRQYRRDDRDAVLAIHDANAPGRFPGNARELFENFLNDQVSSFFVAVDPAGEILACCGVATTSERYHTLCFGLIAPRYHGLRLGSTMTLARLVYASRVEETHFAAICAVPRSIGFYERFGFSVKSEWHREAGIGFPFATLGYERAALRKVSRVLAARGHLIDENIPVHVDSQQRAEFSQDEIGLWKISLHPVSAAAPCEASTTQPSGRGTS